MKVKWQNVIVKIIVRYNNLYQSIAASTCWCGPQPRLSWVTWLLAFLRVPVIPHIQSFFSRAALWITEEGPHSVSLKFVA